MGVVKKKGGEEGCGEGVIESSAESELTLSLQLDSAGST